MEYIYIVANELLPKMVKIGRTKNLEKRLIELSQILPCPFYYVKTYEVVSSAHAEKFIHDALVNLRVNNDREFFHADSMEQIVQACDDILLSYSYFYLKKKYKSISKIERHQDIVPIIVGIRRAKLLTQSDMSDKSGLSPSTITRIEGEATNVSIETLLKILDVLDCSLYIGLSEDKEQGKQRIRKHFKNEKYYRVTQPEKQI